REGLSRHVAALVDEHEHEEDEEERGREVHLGLPLPGAGAVEEVAVDVRSLDQQVTAGKDRVHAEDELAEHGRPYRHVAVATAHDHVGDQREEHRDDEPRADLADREIELSDRSGELQHPAPRALYSGTNQRRARIARRWFVALGRIPARGIPTDFLVRRSPGPSSGPGPSRRIPSPSGPSPSPWP